jgi:hypothetical protein
MVPSLDRDAIGIVSALDGLLVKGNEVEVEGKKERKSGQCGQLGLDPCRGCCDPESGSKKKNLALCDHVSNILDCSGA